MPLVVEGQLLDALGNPAAGRRIELVGPKTQPRSTTTDANGRFEFRFEPTSPLGMSFLLTPDEPVPPGTSGCGFSRDVRDGTWAGEAPSFLWQLGRAYRDVRGPVDLPSAPPDRPATPPPA